MVTETMTITYLQYSIMSVLSAFMLSFLILLSIGLIAISIGGRNFRNKMFLDGMDIIGEITRVEGEVEYRLEKEE